jgi:glycosyl transferase, family 25
MKLIILGLILAIIMVLCLILYKQNKENFNGLKNLNGINSFDNYFYINLEHRKDRKKQITDELKKMKIPEDKIIRINAVRNKYNGHIGCCKSHIKTIELAKKMNLNNAVVFEDDFVFTLSKDEVDKKINHFFKTYPNYDVIQLTTAHKSLKDINDKHIKKVNNATTSSAYIINKKFYNRLLDDLNDSKEKMEKEMIEFNKKNGGLKKKKHQTGNALDQHWGKLQKNSNWYIFEPYLGKQGGSSGGSSIMGGIEAFRNNIKFHNIKV